MGLEAIVSTQKSCEKLTLSGLGIYDKLHWMVLQLICRMRCVWRSRRSLIVRMSGKRQKRGRPPTPDILLSGMFVLLRVLDFLTHINFDLKKSTNPKIPHKNSCQDYPPDCPKMCYIRLVESGDYRHTVLSGRFALHRAR